jgi:DNA-binding HxlR family transcriptional regulator
MGRTADYSSQHCSVAATLSTLGDPWTLLILRDAFLGLRRFEQWRDRLGVARNVLALRLKTLVADGLMEKRAYSDRPVRYEYVLTPKGTDTYSILMSLRAWGDQHIYGVDARPQSFLHLDCGHELNPILTCAHCMKPATPKNIRRKFRLTAEELAGGRRPDDYEEAATVEAMNPPPRTLVESTGS